MTRITEQSAAWTRAPLILIGVLALQPLPYLVALTWGEYARLLLITVGLGYLMWRYSRVREERPEGRMAMMGILLALGFVFIINQFNKNTIPAETVSSIAIPFWISSVLVISAFVVSLWNRQLKGLNDWLDWVAIGLAIVFIAVSVGSSLISGQEVPWETQGKILISLLLWFAATRMCIFSPGSGKKLAAGLLGVFVLISLAGLIQLGGIFFYSYRGDSAREQENLQTAVEHYQCALGISERLKLDRVKRSAAFDLAGVLFAQGEKDRAAETLSMERGFVELVPADAWDGPEGGNLYYLTSCWKDLALYAGEVAILIYAHGTPAMDVWPLMQVRLGDRILGDVFVKSTEPKAYVFLVNVKERTRERLEISFLNDFQQTTPYIDRNLKIEQAEIQYRHIAWE
jgi:hypothetical protein